MRTSNVFLGKKLSENTKLVDSFKHERSKQVFPRIIFYKLLSISIVVWNLSWRRVNVFVEYSKRIRIPFECSQHWWIISLFCDRILRVLLSIPISKRQCCIEAKKNVFRWMIFLKSLSKIFVGNITKTEKFVAHTPNDCQIFASETSNCISIMENLLDNWKFSIRPIVFITIFKRMR